MRFGSLFAGIGGFDLGLERSGMTCAWQVELDGFCRKVLAKHWPGVRRWDDVKTFPPEGDWGVDLICGGFPCQPVSVAGQRKGSSDDRWLWPDMHRICTVLRPRWVLVENVPGLLSAGDVRGGLFGTILRDLAAVGYRVEWHCIPAAAVGAPHIRDRVWIVGNTTVTSQNPFTTGRGSRGAVGESSGNVSDIEHGRVEGRRGAADASAGVPDGRRIHAADEPCYTEEAPAMAAHSVSYGSGSRGSECEGLIGPPASFRTGGDVPDTDITGLEGWLFGGERAREQLAGACREAQQRIWKSDAGIRRVAHGIPKRVDRLRGLGNAVVPQVVEWIGRRIMEVDAHATVSD